MRKDMLAAVDDAGTALYDAISRCSLGEDDASKFSAESVAMRDAGSDYRGFSRSLDRCMEIASGDPSIVAPLLMAASRVAAVYSDEWEPIGRRASPFGKAPRSVPVVGVVGDDGTVWDERYKEEILANAKPVFPGIMDACDPGVR